MSFKYYDFREFYLSLSRNRFKADVDIAAQLLRYFGELFTDKHFLGCPR